MSFLDSLRQKFHKSARSSQTPGPKAQSWRKSSLDLLTALYAKGVLVKVQTPQGPKLAVPTPSDHSLFHAISLADYGHQTNPIDSKTEVLNFIRCYEEEFKDYLQNFTGNMNQYFQQREQNGNGIFGDGEIIAFCMARGCTISLCKKSEIDHTWRWYHYPPVEMSGLCSNEWLERYRRYFYMANPPNGHINLHQTGSSHDAEFALVVDDMPPLIELSSPLRKLKAARTSITVQPSTNLPTVQPSTKPPIVQPSKSPIFQPSKKPTVPLLPSTKPPTVQPLTKPPIVQPLKSPILQPSKKPTVPLFPSTKPPIVQPSTKPPIVQPSTKPTVLQLPKPHTFKPSKRPFSSDPLLGYQPPNKKPNKPATSQAPPGQTNKLLPPEYISVPSPEGYRNAVPLTVKILHLGGAGMPVEYHRWHCLFQAFSLEMFGHIDIFKCELIRTLVYKIMWQYRDRFEPYIKLSTLIYNYRNVAEYIAKLTSGHIGPCGEAEIIAWCAATGYKVSLCKKVNDQWTWLHYPPQQMQDICTTESTKHQNEQWQMDLPNDKHLKLHQAGLPDDGIFSVIVDDPNDDPRFRSDSSRQLYEQEMQIRKDRNVISEIDVREGPRYLMSISGDGNCLYRALSMAMEGTEDYHRYYRLLAFETEWRNPGQYHPRRQMLHEMCKDRPDGVYGTTTEAMAFCMATAHTASIYENSERWPHQLPAEYMPKLEVTLGHVFLRYTGSGNKGHYELLLTKPDPPRKRNIPRIWNFLENIPESPQSP